MSVNWLPFHWKGSSLSHIVMFVVLDKVGFTVKFKLVIESQPVIRFSLLIL